MSLLVGYSGRHDQNTQPRDYPTFILGIRDLGILDVRSWV